jgi:Calx-beta domain
MLQFSAPTYTVNENAHTATITVTRTAGSSGAVSVFVSTGLGTATPGVDYVLTGNAITFVDGDNTPKSVDIGLIDDNLSEGPETVGLNLSGPTGGAVLGAQSTAVLTIVDDEPAPSGGGGGGGSGGGCAIDPAARDVSLLVLLALALVARLVWGMRRPLRVPHRPSGRVLTNEPLCADQH